MSEGPDDKRRVSEYRKEQQRDQQSQGDGQRSQPSQARGQRGQPQSGGQRGQQPQGQPPQGKQPRGQPQGQPPQGQPPHGGGPPGRGGSGDAGLTRRQLLTGGAGAAAVAAGAGWWFFLRGGLSGAEAVADEYVNAVADNDWEAAGALFHEDSSFGLNNDPYEVFLERRRRLETLESISPSVEGRYTTIRITDVAAAAEAGDISLSGEIDPAAIDELKQIRVFASIQTANLEAFENQTDYLSDAVTVDFNITMVLDTGDWSISETFETPRLL